MSEGSDEEVGEIGDVRSFSMCTVKQMLLV